jgi:hypothetical protein
MQIPGWLLFRTVNNINDLKRSFLVAMACADSDFCHGFQVSTVAAD